MIFAPYSLHNFVFNPYFLSEFKDYEVREPKLSSLFHVWDKVWTTQEFWFVFGKNNRLFSLSEGSSMILRLNTASYSEGTRDSVSDVEQTRSEAYR